MRSPKCDPKHNCRQPQTDVAIDQFGNHAVREDHGAPWELGPSASLDLKQADHIGVVIIVYVTLQVADHFGVSVERQ